MQFRRKGLPRGWELGIRYWVLGIGLRGFARSGEQSLAILGSRLWRDVGYASNWVLGTRIDTDYTDYTDFFT